MTIMGYSCKSVVRNILATKCLWGVIVAFLMPLGLVYAADEDHAEMTKCAYVILVMAILWITGSFPIATTSLLPLVMFPMLKLAEAKTVSSFYVTDTSMLLLGAFMFGVAVESSGLHCRIALAIMSLVGTRPPMLMLGLMVPTWFLSMWMSNVAATTIMLPIITAVIHTVGRVEESSENGVQEEAEVMQLTAGITDIRDSDSREDKAEKEFDITKCRPEVQRLAKGMCIAVAYAANAGGTAVLTGVTTNLVFKQHVDELYAQASRRTGSDVRSPVTFATWAAYAFPLSIVLLVVAWLWLQLLFLRGKCFKRSVTTVSHTSKCIRNRLKRLGPMTFAEIVVIFATGAYVALLLSRDPPGHNGWGRAFESQNRKFVSDSTPALLISLLLFIIPGKVPKLFRGIENGEKPKYEPLLTWSVVEKSLQWGLLLLLGGGFAIAKMSERTGLSTWLGTRMSHVTQYEPWLMNVILSCIAAVATEVTSNTATVTLLLPILSALGTNNGINPLYLTLNATVACSFAFMLPVATPSNAAIFSLGYVTIGDMVIAGLPMNCFALLILSVSMETWGAAIFNFKDTSLFSNMTTQALNTSIST